MCADAPALTPEAALRARFVGAMSRAATGVCVIATDGPAGRLGLTVSAVSADPPLLLACVNRRNRLRDALLANRCFALNLLAPGQAALADVFAGRTPDRADAYRFDPEAWSPGLSGSPVLAGAAASFDCRLEAWHEAGTHTIIIGGVLDAACGGAAQLAYCRRAYARTVALGGG